MAIFKNKQFLYSVAVLVGTMVGVGIFGIPFAFAKAGFWVGTSFLVAIAIITLLVDLLYGEIILRTDSQHQLTGYTELYLGPTFKKIIFFSIAFSSYAALLAYIIISGEFLSNVFLFWQLNPDTYSYLFFIFFSTLVLIGIKRVSWLELVLTLLFIGVIVIVFFAGFGQVNSENYRTPNFYYWFLPYGVLLFAFAGLSGVPIQKEVLAGKEKLLKKSIIWAVAIVSLLYFLFAFTVVGISGDITTPDAIKGLYEFLGDRIIFLGSLFGALAVGTAYMMLGTALSEIFQYDYGIKKFFSWVLVVIPPIIFFIGGIRTFIDIIGLAGAVALALEMAILVLIYIKAKKHGKRNPEYSLSVPKFILYFLVLIFVAGIGYALIN
ncbi:MAG: hypothetical protein A3J46_05925 [Candidatus Yanofskybacteria bacterium RIFCSPHIGHO2_02_FULL_41_11]|uniref:Amino acid transporter transmembrane domain-containing protein n=1 Tax=Candidatus Yanofskybacteria bacterium RIFCSPHIGHO2_02_FULL_41_11 TaxID=1802675 RepID=A0A1F8FAP9_9BACT|nr:MAG: hypothetical protein A3J46_05925 [Candidatus Yanofskybacteria bacterium RIFCSPHIGHO2_02_FULL_41_11]